MTWRAVFTLVTTLSSTPLRIVSFASHISRITCGAPLDTLKAAPVVLCLIVASVRLMVGSNGV